MEELKILCVISISNIKRDTKNMECFHGLRLLCNTINNIKKCNYYKNMRVILSTDCEYYSQIAKELGVDVPFLTGSYINYEYINILINWLKTTEYYYPNIIINLKISKKSTINDDLNKSIFQFINIRNKYDSLRSVQISNECPYKMYNINDDELLPLFLSVKKKKEPYNQLEELLPKTYIDKDYINIFNTDILKDLTITGVKIYPFII